jgi:hypothetical protein
MLAPVTRDARSDKERHHARDLVLAKAAEGNWVRRNVSKSSGFCSLKVSHAPPWNTSSPGLDGIAT